MNQALTAHVCTSLLQSSSALGTWR